MEGLLGRVLEGVRQHVSRDFSVQFVNREGEARALLNPGENSLEEPPVGNVSVVVGP